MVSLVMIMLTKFMDGLPQGPFAEQNHAFQARFLDGSHEALRVGIAACHQPQVVGEDHEPDFVSLIHFTHGAEPSMN